VAFALYIALISIYMHCFPQSLPITARLRLGPARDIGLLLPVICPAAVMWWCGVEGHAKSPAQRRHRALHKTVWPLQKSRFNARNPQLARSACTSVLDSRLRCFRHVLAKRLRVAVWRLRRSRLPHLVFVHMRFTWKLHGCCISRPQQLAHGACQRAVVSPPRFCTAV
jgi:hypothetical protein